ncbi:hypothetical protein [Bacillus inaquosorum]|uniref:hypothetical protein n=1 Tax=Bacillus inaquosorum TaxID=483913 RepID=UPI00227F8170|nr:hypothetical protein [Bacillus inaquosorum]MCY9066639.1 hypothetical protein [Bacillus inaquosorum]
MRTLYYVSGVILSFELVYYVYMALNINARGWIHASFAFVSIVLLGILNAIDK